MADKEWFLVCTEVGLTEAMLARLQRDLDEMVAGKRPYTILNGYGARVVPVTGGNGDTFVIDTMDRGDAVVEQMQRRQRGQRLTDGVWIDRKLIHELMARMEELLRRAGYSIGFEEELIMLRDGVDEIIGDLRLMVDGETKVEVNDG